MLHNNVVKQSYDTKRYYICAGTDEKGYVKEGDYMEMKMEWIKCPVCGNKTRNKMREDTVLKQFPLYCPKCKQETLVEIEGFLIKVIEEPDAKTQSQLL